MFWLRLVDRILGEFLNWSLLKTDQEIREEAKTLVPSGSRVLAYLEPIILGLSPIVRCNCGERMVMVVVRVDDGDNNGRVWDETVMVCPRCQKVRENDDGHSQAAQVA